MPSVSTSSETKKNLKLLKVALMESGEFENEPSFDQVINWMGRTQEVPKEKIENMNMEAF